MESKVDDSALIDADENSATIGQKPVRYRSMKSNFYRMIFLVIVSLLLVFQVGVLWHYKGGCVIQHHWIKMLLGIVGLLIICFGVVSGCFIFNNTPYSRSVAFYSVVTNMLLGFILCSLLLSSNCSTTTTHKKQVCKEINITNTTCEKVVTNIPTHLWTFDNNSVNDARGLYAGKLINKPQFVKPGCIGNSLLLNGGSSISTKSEQQVLRIPFIDFSHQSFTIEFWIYLTGSLNEVNHLLKNQEVCILEQCDSFKTQHCLHLAIRDYVVFFDFLNDETSGITRLQIRQWYHLVFVYNVGDRQRIVYLNGVLDAISSKNVGPYKGQNGTINIGSSCFYNETGHDHPYGNFKGQIDELAITLNRSKTACEISNYYTKTKCDRKSVHVPN